jgi:hypothetical protein
MKKVFSILALTVFLGAGIPAGAEPVFGFIYKDTTEAAAGFSNAGAAKVGVSECTSYFGIVALGNCSVNAAAKNGKISVVSYYDVHTKNILGYKKVKVKAYGN